MTLSQPVRATVVAPENQFSPDEQLSRWKETMGMFASGLTVITATDEDGSMTGSTVSAFSSLSLRPRLLLICLDKRSRTLEVVRRTGRFAINILSNDGRDLAFRFGSKDEEKFTGVAWQPGYLGCPLLTQSCASIECWLEQVHDGGDHEILVGSPSQITHDRDRQPLIYHRSSFM
ncbi:flavin reductase family protein [Pseudomonas chengduensis]|nr:flavin reductase family protein [Pseudomonas chengduensis]MDH1866517.1 flavin reductase family protein [Pseudomonas chengduensis]